jgi:hypothetical protein
MFVLFFFLRNLSLFSLNQTGIRQETDREGRPIPVLKTSHPFAIAGVLIPSLTEPIPEGLRPTVEAAFKKLLFHVKYMKGKSWEDKKRAENLSEEKIKSMRKFVKNNQSMWRPPTKDSENDEKAICWTAKSHTFQDKNGHNYTVLTYYREKYGIALKYEEMPLVRVSKTEYFPVEFLYQGKVRLCRWFLVAGSPNSYLLTLFLL